MFSRLCKNSIFPSGSGGGGNSSNSSGAAGASTAASSTAAGSSPSEPVSSSAAAATTTTTSSSSSSSRRHLNLPLLPVLPPRSAAQIRPEPPPPYWAHYQHRVVPAAVVHPPIPLARSSSTSSSSSSSAGVNASSNAHRLRGPAAVYGGGVGAEGYQRAVTLERDRATHRYNIAHQQQRQRIKEYLLSQDAFCPDLVRNCKITADPQSGRNSPESVPSTSQQPQNHQPRTDRTPDQDQDVYVEIEELNQSVAAVQLATPEKPQPPTSTTSSTTVVCGDMGQNLSIRRPKISLTWVLREQQQQQQQSQQQQQQLHQNQSANDRRPPQISGNYLQPSSQSRRASPVKTTAVAPVPPPAPSSGSSNGAAVPARKKSRTRSKERLFSEKYVSDNNLTEYGYNEKLKAVHGGQNGGASAPASTEHHGSNGHHHHNGVYRKSNRSYRKNSDRLKKKERTLVYPSLVQSETVDILLNNNNSIIINLNQEEQQQLLKEKSLKNTYSEPSLYTTVSEPSSSKNRHRHRRRRERYHRSASQRFGYEIQNVDEFLSKCSLSSPGNIPVVLAAAATLYQTRPGSYQIEIPLPLGMVVNAVFKNQNWLYVQTPHAEEGYVAYETCLPLGILPPNQRSSSTSKPTPCWESNKDVFPRPSGNLTDSEKEIQQLRGGSNTATGAGTRSEGRRTPRLKRNGTSSRSVASVACSSEKNLDSLYLRVANQPKSADSQSQFAQLKLTPKVLNGKSAAAAATAKLDKVLNMDQLDKLPSNGDYIQLHKPMQHNPQQNPFHHHHHHKILVKSGSGGSGHSASSVLNGGHYHKTVNNVSYSNSNATAKTTTNGSANLRTSATTAVRQTLLAITDSYSSEAVSVQKGDVVTLLACKEYQEKGLKNYKQWFFVRTRDGHEGYIPAEAAGHGFL